MHSKGYEMRSSYVTVAALLLYSGICTAQEVQNKTINLDWVQKRVLQVPITFEDGLNVNPGDAVAVYNQNEIVFKPGITVNAKSTPMIDCAQLIYRFLDGESKTQEERSAVMNAEASFLGVNAGGGFNNQAIKNVDTHTVYLVVDMRTGFKTISGSPVFKLDNAFKTTGTDAEKFSQFINHYGTHYVTEVYYGYKLIVRADFTGVDEKQKDEAKAFLRSGLLFSANVEARTNVVRSLQLSKTGIQLKVIGGRVDNQAGFVAVGAEGLAVFFDNYFNKKIAISPGPYAAQLQSYSSIMPPGDALYKYLAGDAVITNADLKDIKSEVLELPPVEMQPMVFRQQPLESAFLMPVFNDYINVDKLKSYSHPIYRWSGAPIQHGGLTYYAITGAVGDIDLGSKDLVSIEVDEDKTVEWPNNTLSIVARAWVAEWNWRDGGMPDHDASRGIAETRYQLLVPAGKGKEIVGIKLLSPRYSSTFLVTNTDVVAPEDAKKQGIEYWDGGFDFNPKGQTVVSRLHGIIDGYGSPDGRQVTNLDGSSKITVTIRPRISVQYRTKE